METKHDRIKHLNDRQKARDKISIWFGSSTNYTHGLKEVIANATDEIINHFEHGYVTVELFEDLRTIQVTDTGRGMQIDGETDGVPNYELLLRTLFAGTKYGDDDEQTYTGTNGVGTTVLNFTSEFYEVESYYDGYLHTIAFSNGGEITHELSKEKCKKDAHGTVVTFRLDPEIYPVVEYIPDQVKDIVKRYAISSPKVTLIYKYQLEEEKFNFDSVEDYYNELVGNTSTSPIITMAEATYDDDDEKTKIKVVLSTNPEPTQEAYLNLTYLAEGGFFNKGVIDGVRNFSNKYCKDNRLFPKGVTSFSTSDIESSISFVCVAFSNKVEFKNQTKLSTEKKLYEKVAQKHTYQQMDIFRIENEPGLKKFINHLLAVQKHNAAALKSRQDLKKQLTAKVEGIGNKVANFVDSKIHGEEAEVYIVEGRSALGSIVLARNSLFQAAYPLRGKILNCLKAPYSVIFKNQVIKDLVRVLGCGIQADAHNRDLETFDKTKLRYGKIIIATDADPDGAQIAALNITMIYRLMPQLLIDGHIYIALTPLYEVKFADDSVIYFYTESEKDEKISTLKGKYTISRCKGLGELDSDTMEATAMNPETRRLVRVTVDDAEEMARSIENWMADDVSYRKEYIENNLCYFIEVYD